MVHHVWSTEQFEAAEISCTVSELIELSNDRFVGIKVHGRLCSTKARAAHLHRRHVDEPSPGLRTQPMTRSAIDNDD